MRPCPPRNELAKICTGALYQISTVKKHVSDWRRSGLTASAPVSGVSAPAWTNGVWPPLRPVSVALKNKPSTMLSSNVQSIDLRMVGTAWWFWTMRQPNGCSTPAPKSTAAKQWCEGLAQKKKWLTTSLTGVYRTKVLTALLSDNWSLCFILQCFIFEKNCSRR